MCGILGGYWKSSNCDLENKIRFAIDALTHRGPDDSGFEMFPLSIGMLALGHTRLSIIDLSSRGHQPMTSSCGRYIIAFNGEIYNYIELRKELIALGYVFQTNTDTEVLLYCWVEWGCQCLNRLVGMYAFSVVDKKLKTLSLIRDAFGIKPLFYSSADSGFAFASELNALKKILNDESTINKRVAYQYLVNGAYDNQEDTFYENIYLLLPGHVMTVDLSGNEVKVKKKKWWNPSIDEDDSLSFKEAADKLRHMFLDSVRLHLRSDVPLGAALSGGLDSSAVVCAMRYIEPSIPIHTFSYIEKNSPINEEHWVNLVNAEVNAVAHKITLNSDNLYHDLNNLICSQGQPFGSTSIFAQYKVYEEAKKNGIKVTLDGQGADELLAGYHGYPGARMRSLVGGNQYVKLLHFANAWHKWPGRSAIKSYMHLAHSLLPAQVGQFIKKNIARKALPNFIVKNSNYTSNDEIISAISKYAYPKNRHLMAELRACQGMKNLNSLLRHGDRNSMAWSIESRVPFLTTDLASFLLKQPENYLLSDQGETKHLFRAAMRDIVPDAILYRRDKVGFETSDHNLLRPLLPKLNKYLEGLESIDFIDVSQCRKYVDGVQSGSTPMTWQLWRLLNLGVFFQSVKY